MVSAKAIVLIVSIVMPGDAPDINHMAKMKSFDDCWSDAREFVERDLTEDMRQHGALGLKATCGYYEMPSEQN